MTRTSSERTDDGAVARDAEDADGVPGGPAGRDRASGDEVDRDPRSSDPRASPAVESVLRALDRLRTHPRDRWIALTVAAIVGLALAWLHWFGLIVGGALAGLVSRSLGRALLAGIGFGVVALAIFAVTLGGSLGAAVAMTPATYLTVGAALGLPAFGSLARGMV